MLTSAVSGGRTTYGHSMGALMLDTRFPRPPGDIGNALTWPFPMLYKVVRGASPARILRDADPALLQPFIDAGNDLVAQGVRAITTSCGYLAIFQRELSASIPVPVLSSSLLQVPMASRLCGDSRRIGIITVRDMLTERHFNGVGWSRKNFPVSIGVLPTESLFTRVHAPLDPEDAIPPVPEGAFANEVVETALKLVRDEPSISAIVMECTNLVPYSGAVREATQLPVFDHYTLVMNAYHALLGPDFGATGPRQGWRQE